MNLDTSLHLHFSFDLWLTLIKSNPYFKEKRNILFRDFFAIDHSIDKVREVIRYYDVLANKISELTGIHFDGNQIYCLALNDLKVDINQIDHSMLVKFGQEVDRLFLDNKPVLLHDNIHKLFRRIQNDSKTISLLSNTAFIKGEVLRDVLDSYGLSQYFLFQIYSDEVGISKPNEDIFKLVHDLIKKTHRIEKNDILHIGDNRIADYEGATRYGFNALLV